MVKNLCFVVAVLNAMDYLNNRILLFSYKEDKSFLVLSMKIFNSMRKLATQIDCELHTDPLCDSLLNF